MTRFTDDMAHNTEGSDFVVRQRRPLSLQILLAFAVAFTSIYLTALYMYSEGGRTPFLFTLTFMLGGLAWFSVYFSARLRDLVLATEFQNAMFASAAQLSTRFCMITKRDGSIVYFDPGFQKLFPYFQQSGNRTIDGLLATAGIAPEIVEKISQMLARQHSDRVLLPLSFKGEPLPVMMTVDLLPRPKGYFLMRGRDYVESRISDSYIAPHVAAPLAHALNVLPEGIIVADAGGTITFANATIETWLGYAPGELAIGHVKTSQLILQYEGQDAGLLLQSDFEGGVALLSKDQKPVYLTIRQVVFGKPAGITALITHTNGVKKK